MTKMANRSPASVEDVRSCSQLSFVNPLMGTLKPQSNGPSYSSTLLVHWPLMGGLLHLVQRGVAWAEPQPAQAPPRCTKCTKDNYNATSNNTKLVHWPLMGGLLHLVQRGGAWGAAAPPSPLLAVPNVAAHPSTAIYIYIVYKIHIIRCGTTRTDTHNFIHQSMADTKCRYKC